MTRICITGGPRTGKTTLAGRLVEDGNRDYDRRLRDAVAANHALLLHIPPTVRHTDDIIHLGWSEASQAAALWLDEPGPWIIEGVAVSRALRKWRDQHPGERPPVDRVICLTETFEEPTAGQRTMAKGVETVHREIEGWLAQHGVRTEFPVERELVCMEPGYNGIAKLE